MSPRFPLLPLRRARLRAAALFTLFSLPGALCLALAAALLQPNVALAQRGLAAALPTGEPPIYRGASPTPTPAITPTAAITSGLTPTPAPAITPTPALTQTTAADKVIYLTFDDGPWPPNTGAILDLLAAHDARATFFVVGTQARVHGPLLERVHAEGHGLANHTWGHRSLKSASWDTFSAQVTSLADLLGDRESKCLRPPYGDFDANTGKWAESLGYRVVMYSVDPQDWKSPGAAVVAQRILARARPGAIIVLHDGGGSRAQTVAALETVIPALQAEGYRFEALCRDSFPAPQSDAAPAPAQPPGMDWANGGITSPGFGATLSGEVTVEGTATAAEFRKWQLDVLLFGSGDAASFVALGEEQVPAPAALATLDTRALPNGRHTLRLRVVRADGNYLEWYTQVVFAN